MNEHYSETLSQIPLFGFENTSNVINSFPFSWDTNGIKGSVVTVYYSLVGTTDLDDLPRTLITVQQEKRTGNGCRHCVKSFSLSGKYACWLFNVSMTEQDRCALGATNKVTEL